MRSDQWFDLAKILLTVLLTYSFGQRVASVWQMRNKRRELDIAAASQFQAAFAEYKEIWRLWKIAEKQPVDEFAKKIWWDLVSRAAAVESKVEAIMLKLVVERKLEEKELRSIGLFRQGFQNLRRAIRDRKPLEYSSEHPEYRLINQLGTEVACLILSNERIVTPQPGEAAKQLEFVISMRELQWDDAARQLAVRLPSASAETAPRTD